MRKTNLILVLACSLVCLLSSSTENAEKCLFNLQWTGKKAIILGDSISDKIHIGTTKCWWEFLGEFLKMETISYAVNGSEFNNVLDQARKVLEEQNQNFDLLIIFAGTNDFNSNINMGEWFSEERGQVNRNGQMVECLHRTPIINDTTFKGRLNELALFLKRHFPKKQIIFLTPIHRAFARFCANNIQPDESWANENDLYIDDYVEAIKEACNIWSFPVINLNAECGIYPIEEAQAIYFHDKMSDRLHPNAEGHKRMAKTIASHLRNIPCL